MMSRDHPNAEIAIDFDRTAPAPHISFCSLELMFFWITLLIQMKVSLAIVLWTVALIPARSCNAKSPTRLLKAKKGKKGKKVSKAGKQGSIRASTTDGNLSPMADIVTLGARPYYLLDSMTPSFLKDDLTKCAGEKTSFMKSDFSIGHRGACMQYPEDTIRSFEAAALMGAGILECDVTFTKDRELVCRHAQCDLHTSTDVVSRPEMNAKCSTPWAPGVSPRCCASDFTLEEIKTLCAKMDSSVSGADTAEGYVYGGTAAWRTDVHQYECPPVPTHKESIKMIKVRRSFYLFIPQTKH